MSRSFEVVGFVVDGSTQVVDIVSGPSLLEDVFTLFLAQKRKEVSARLSSDNKRNILGTTPSIALQNT